MSIDEKQRHTLANCTACYHTAGEQANFPQKPIYTPPGPVDFAIKSSVDQLKAELENQLENQPKPLKSEQPS